MNNNPYDSNSPLKAELYDELQSFLSQAYMCENTDNLIKIDLHCHDYNSNVPDELIGRILNVPETWTKTSALVKNLEKNKVDVITVTNHNNTRSCYELQDKGFDILTGAEFSCMVPDFKIGIHVLTFGFNTEQEEKLQNLRTDIYAFQQYTCEQNIPTIWAHPLYHYKSTSALPPMAFFEKMSLIFERFEVLNGQRDTWQNMLVKEWVDRLDKETIDKFAAIHKINPNDYCHNVYKKSMSGGSDSHIGLFAGQTGTYLKIANLANRKKKETMSALALEALRNGDMFPFGLHNDSTRLIVSLLDYVCQIALNRKDPGLMRVILHKGSYRDKLLALLASNGFAELQHHKNTMRIVELIHNSFMGKKPKPYESWLIPNDYKKVFAEAVNLSSLSASNSNSVNEYNAVIQNIYTHLNTLLLDRFKLKIEQNFTEKDLSFSAINDLISRFELPSDVREYLPKKEKNTKRSHKDKSQNLDLVKFLDGLSFPFLSTGLILAANFTGIKALYNNRKLLESFSNNLNKFINRERILWLFDINDDSNSLANLHKSALRQIQSENLPIDMLVCGEKISQDKNLIVVKPGLVYKNPLFEGSLIKVPDFLEVQKIFETNEYTKIICSSDSVMGLLALYLKTAFSVPASIIVGENKIAAIDTKHKTDESNRKMITRALRMFYNSFDNVILTNSELKDWICGRKMAIPDKKVLSVSDNNSKQKSKNASIDILGAKLLENIIKPGH